MKTAISKRMELELSPKFDVEDIRKLREYNSLRHINMTHEEIIAETRAETADIVEQLMKSGNIIKVVRV